jgi:hypothetical protein
MRMSLGGPTSTAVGRHQKGETLSKSADLDPKPDAAELVFRFGCGSAFGAITSLFALRSFFQDDRGVLIRTVITAIVFGVLAMIYGPYFWRRIVGWWPR